MQIGFFNYILQTFDNYKFLYSIGYLYIPLFALYVVYIKQLSFRKFMYRNLIFNILLGYFLNSSIIDFDFRPYLIILFFVNFVFLIIALFSKFYYMSGIRGGQGKATLPLNKWIIYPIESLLLFSFYVLGRLIPLKIMSWLGEKAARFVSKLNLKVNRITLKNIRKCYPDYSDKQCQKLLTDAWVVFLKFLFETPQFNYFAKNYNKFVSIEGMEYLEELKGKPFVVMFAHYGNISILMLPFKALDMRVSLVYRFPNNHLTDWFFNISINLVGGTPIPKGEAGTKLLFKSLKNNIPVMIAVDQKFEGKGSIDATFFGRKAPSAPGVVKLAETFKCPILPMRSYRLDGVNQKIVIDKPFFLKESSEIEQQRINDIVEKWVKEDPKQWLWLHNRWKKES